jgi:hypothetical protein
LWEMERRMLKECVRVKGIRTGKGHTYASEGVLQVYVQTLGMMCIRLTVTR